MTMRILPAVTLALPLMAAYSYFYTANFELGIPGAFLVTGTFGGYTNGLNSSTANGASVIYQTTIPDGTA